MTRHPAYDDEPIDWGDAPPEPPPPPSAGRSIRLGFEAVYDYLGASIAASVLLFVVFSVPLSVLYAAAGRMANPATRLDGVVFLAAVLLIAPLVVSPLTAGVFVLVDNMRRHDDPHLLDIGRGAVRLAPPAIGLGYLQTFAFTVLLSDTLFLLARPETALKVCGILVAYATLFAAMTAFYSWPLLVQQNPGLKTLVYRSLLLAAANPFYTLALTLFLFLLCVGPVALFFGFRYGPAVLVPVSMLWGVLIPSLQAVATAEILRKYDA